MIEKIIEPLREWYGRNKRSLPWREEQNPYYIWVSEIMLQQTRVEAVKPYFKRFIAALPDVNALAACPEDQLLKLWEGLGYYNRVRNMQKAACAIRDKYGGSFPREYEELKKLSGIGSYTAGAIASIAFGRPVPAVDGNVLRVLARLREDDRDISSQTVKNSVERELLPLMPKENPGEFNQALMELGAMVCLPNGRPQCEICPLQTLCRAHGTGRELDFPRKKSPKERRVEDHTILLIQDGSHLVFQKRPSRGLLAGLYEFPNLLGHLERQEVLDWVEEAGFLPLHIQPLESARHIFSHVEWRMIGYAVRVASPEGKVRDGLILADKDGAEKNYPLPSAYRAYAGYMNLNLGLEREKNHEIVISSSTLL